MLKNPLFHLSNYFHFIILPFIPRFYSNLLTNVPIPSIETFTISPDFKNLGGLNPLPTPAGVPVKITSPGSSVTDF